MDPNEEEMRKKEFESGSTARGGSKVGINVTPDRDTADPFDGTNSYRVRYETGWVVTTGEDMYMTLKQTHG